jgi:uncharacterized protein
MPQFRDARASMLYKQLTSDSSLIDTGKPNALTELVLNISQGCNLGCSYCFADKGKYGTQNTSFMTFENAKRSIDAFISKFGGVASIKLFGGEPLLNFDLIKKICDYLAHLVEENKIQNIPMPVVITNLTILNDEMINYFKKYNFSVTVSLDGPESINDSFRKLTRPTAYNSIIIE